MKRAPIFHIFQQFVKGLWLAKGGDFCLPSKGGEPSPAGGNP